MARVTEERAEELASEHFGLSGTASELPSYIDQNFLLDCGADRFVVKFASPEVALEEVELENAVMQRVAAAAPSAPCPRVRESVGGLAINTCFAHSLAPVG